MRLVMPSEYIVIDKGTANSWEDAAIVTDEEGRNKVFRDYKEAEQELEECQSGIVVGTEDIPDHTPTLIEDVHTMLTQFYNTVFTLPSHYQLFFSNAVKSSPKGMLERIENWQKTLEEEHK